MAPTRNAFIDLFWRIHPKLYRWSSGRIGGHMMGLPVLLLTTKGRKTGVMRTKALMYLPRGDDLVVIASYLGEPQHPAWWLNLEANPKAIVEIGNARYSVVARKAEGEEREELWRAVTDKVPVYVEYQSRTSRRIPIVILERQ